MIWVWTYPPWTVLSSCDSKWTSGNWRIDIMFGIITTNYSPWPEVVVLTTQRMMLIHVIHISELASVFILIGAWQVVENEDGFEVIYWKFLTGAVEENVKRRCWQCIHSLKIICQNVAYLRRRLPVISDVLHLAVHNGGFDQELSRYSGDRARKCPAKADVFFL